MATITHYSAPYTIPAAQWQAFTEGTGLRVVLGDDHHAIDAATYDSDRLLLTVNGDMLVYGLDEDVTVVAPRTTFAAIRAAQA